MVAICGVALFVLTCYFEWCLLKSGVAWWALSVDGAWMTGSPIRSRAGLSGYNQVLCSIKYWCSVTFDFQYTVFCSAW